ncbi:HPr family phosphocarrier protein [Engelhardtia mirabilis]|uniref:PTS HPr component phosphorylation site n=1 Tax=Engelhardtia mirabilis TaxID=2528011 RepID=A0A518BT16_9BACT|nr:PTS HPr component phosphorylation site [Planctomycetes bacterium Pla133]QDV04439.1 PTS HPr component phosphorylation site [Planctomycetes bacterium Pla86]
MNSPAPEAPIEQVIEEARFAELLQVQSEPFFRLLNTVEGAGASGWTKARAFQLLHEAQVLESFLDDHGARTNRRFADLTELVAAIRGFSLTGHSLLHLQGRLDSYGIRDWIEESTHERLAGRLSRATTFVGEALAMLVEAVRSEGHTAGIEPSTGSLAADFVGHPTSRVRLPHNVGQDELSDEEQRIAEVASKFGQAAQMLGELGIQPISEPRVRQEFLARHCTEAQARVYEATVHNLQSTYDTYVKNTVLEANDRRLVALRGYTSISLHLLEAVTHLTHFHERHENDLRCESTRRLLAQVVDPVQVQATILNDLLVGAADVLEAGRPIAIAVLSDYTRIRELEVELPDGVQLHARPVALIVSVVNHHGTPVELEVGPRRCNASSILEVLMAVGSAPDVGVFIFRGDERPLRDIALLFGAGLGEGARELPEGLAYLRSPA